MKVQSAKRPPQYAIHISGDEAVIKFAENIIVKTIESAFRPKGRRCTANADETIETDASTVFEYDCYTLTTINRKGLEADVSTNLEQWIETAKKAEIDKLSADIRAKRDALLAETDKEFALDRVNLNIPEKVTASTMLNTFKDILNVLGSVCNGKMAEYRQALRDIPQQEGFPYDVKFPVKPY